MSTDTTPKSNLGLIIGIVSGLFILGILLGAVMYFTLFKNTPKPVAPSIKPPVTSQSPTSNVTQIPVNSGHGTGINTPSNASSVPAPSVTQPPPPPPPSLVAYDSGLDYAIGSVLMLPGPVSAGINNNDCRFACSNNSLCVGFSVESGNCYLFSGIQSVAKTSPNTKSEIKTGRYPTGLNRSSFMAPPAPPPPPPPPPPPKQLCLPGSNFPAPPGSPGAPCVKMCHFLTRAPLPPGIPGIPC